MKLEIYNGNFVGTVEWRGPGEIDLDVEDPKQREFFAAYFAGNDTYLGGPVECAEMSHSRRDESRQAFAHAAFRLAAYSYTMRDAPERSTA